MATPIKETPILRGKDAQRFEKEIEENMQKKVSPEEYQRGIDAYSSLIGVVKKPPQ